MKVDFEKIDTLCGEFANNHSCSNYEHNNPTKEEMKAFVFDVLKLVSDDK